MPRTASIKLSALSALSGKYFTQERPVNILVFLNVLSG